MIEQYCDCFTTVVLIPDMHSRGSLRLKNNQKWSNQRGKRYDRVLSSWSLNKDNNLETLDIWNRKPG